MTVLLVLIFMVMLLLAIWTKSAAWAIAAAFVFFASNVFLPLAIPTELLEVRRTYGEVLASVDKRFKYVRSIVIIYPFWKSRHIIVLCESRSQCITDISWNAFFFGNTKIGKTASVERSSRDGIYDAINDRWFDKGSLVESYSHVLKSCPYLQCFPNRKFSPLLLNLL